MSKSIYFLSKGALSVKDGSIAFNKEEQEILYFPIKQIEDIYLNINNIYTSNILALLLKEGVYIHYFNNYEYYLGTLIPKNSKFSGSLLMKEMEHYSNLEKRLYLAKGMLVASIKNLNHNIKYYYVRNRLKTKINIGEYVNKINNGKSVNQLLLIEAQARKEYYHSFLDILKIEEFKREFKSDDIINSLLNFLNSLLYSVIFSEIMKTKISGQIGFIHEVADNRYSLIYDIADIFKPLLVDRLIFKLINKKQITSTDIRNGNISEEKIKYIFNEWDRQINTMVYNKSLKKHMSYRRLIREEIYKLENHLKGIKRYRGFLIWW